MSAKAKSAAFDDFADDLLDERKIRPLIIVGTSKVDFLLLEILKAHLLPKTAKAKDSDELLEGDRPLSTFSSRTKICYRLGLIDDSLRITIDKLRGLRNLCAHSISFDVAKSPVRELIPDLLHSMSGRSTFKLTMTRYFDGALVSVEQQVQCILLTICVILESIREKVRVTKGSRTALRISAK